MSITTDVLNELFDYKEGKLYRKTSKGGFAIGTVCGSLHHTGYRNIKINESKHQEHRIIWQMHYGHIPRNKQIDHINRNPLDNRIENLRVVTGAQNAMNKFGKGYELRNSGKFRARIRVNGKQIQLGHFDTEEEAKAAYLEAKEKYHTIEVDNV